MPRSRWIQHSATWPSLCDRGSLSVLSDSIRYVVTELAPASPATSLPAPNVNANGTGVADGFATGAAESRPSGPTSKTSIVLVLAFVVTISFRPSGVKPT